MAKESCGKMIQLLVAKDIQCIENEIADKLIQASKEISFMISRFIESRKDF